MNNSKIYEEIITIPTYEVGKPDKNPMFYEKRVYQGSSGKVYPLPVIDKIYDEKKDKEYKVVWLENDYIKIMVMPELGGRIQRALDKTNNYDFVYYNHVIKPALVGLAGPWISGGIEFNWPQHHRPTTFSPVDYILKENNDGSVTIWLNEIDRMYGTKALMGFTLHPDKAYIEITGQLYNPTDIPQTFLWWANPAVAVNDYTKSIFPPDVHAVFDHGKRDVSEFPIAKGEYYKVDYSPGTDISRYKNIPVPTSYMAYHSDFNFVGGYDFNVDAGVLHIANHHISPGKKQWTWGNGEFGQAWDRALTDEDGPYIELMTGVYTDNQPDFTWLESGEEKTFTQFFMPYKKVGEVKNATIDILINLELDETAKMTIYTTGVEKNLLSVLSIKGEIVYKKLIEKISPITPVELEYNLGKYKRHEVRMEVFSSSGDCLIAYQETKEEELVIPEAAKVSKEPKDIKSLEELFLTGLHLEQYRHATYMPDDYYLEGLKRDDADIRLNNAYGLLLYRRGQYKESEQYFRKAIERLMWKNPNPYDGEALYNLGLSLKMQNRLNEAYDNIYKAVWNDAIKAKGYYQLASIKSIQKDYHEALRLINLSLTQNINNLNSRNLKTILLRKLERATEAESFAVETRELDILDYACRNELYLLLDDPNLLIELDTIMRDEINSYLEIVIFYNESGFYTDALCILDRILKRVESPLLRYYSGAINSYLCNNIEAIRQFNLADKTDSSYCFPNKIASIKILEKAIELTPKLSKTYYYLGNLYYDKLVSDKAIYLWEQSYNIDRSFPTVSRNLALAYYNKTKDFTKARAFLEEAFALDKNDSRILYELDQLYKRINLPLEERRILIENNYRLVTERDDFFIEYITILNNLGNYKKAYQLLLSRQFHIWEGGEGLVVEQYTFALKSLAKIAMVHKKYEDAISHLEMAKIYPHSLGEGKLMNAQENEINYYLGVCHQKLSLESKEYFHLASTGTKEPSAAMFYNDAKPDSIFFQGMALQKLGKKSEALELFKTLTIYGEKHIDDLIKVDYFAISLPSFLIFNEDLQRSNRVHCNYLIGLGLLGQKNTQNSKPYFDEVHKEDINHQGYYGITQEIIV